MCLRYGDDEDGDSLKVVADWTVSTKIIADRVMIHDQAYNNDELVEDTFDWYAGQKWQRFFSIVHTNYDGDENKLSVYV